MALSGARKVDTTLEGLPTTALGDDNVVSYLDDGYSRLCRQELLRRRFEAWLKETGKQREINSLAACKERTSRYEKYKQLAAAGGERETP